MIFFLISTQGNSLFNQFKTDNSFSLRGLFYKRFCMSIKRDLQYNIRYYYIIIKIQDYIPVVKETKGFQISEVCCNFMFFFYCNIYNINNVFFLETNNFYHLKKGTHKQDILYVCVLISIYLLSLWIGELFTYRNKDIY